jgi:uncharacterized membrane protein YbaN (DUF454 family)
MNIKKALWSATGFASLGMAYVGFVLPGIPFSIFLVFAAYCFAKSNKKMHDWIYNHKHFGPFLTNWTEKRVFPFRFKIAMVLVMSSTLMFTFFATENLKAVVYSGVFMALVAGWAWRFPSTVKEHDDRKARGKRIGWFK